MWTTERMKKYHLGVCVLRVSCKCVVILHKKTNSTKFLLNDINKYLVILNNLLIH